ncbi:MAG: hypothetical protein GY895_14305 [Phycisphaera sp.]|nr:hypothetical protein [Phycisphaera sp.]
MHRPTAQMVARRVVFWLGLCSLSATPSLTIAVADSSFATGAQVAGILTFAVIAGVLSSLPWVRARTSLPQIRKPLVIAYTIRTVAVSLPLIMVFPDMIVGMVATLSGGLVAETTFGGFANSRGSISGFIVTYLLVLWQGVLLNGVVWILMLLVWLFQTAFMPAGRLQSSRSSSHEDCPECHYDLQQTSIGQPCPECGAMKIAHCSDCDRLIEPGDGSGTCPDCGSTATYDPRHRSWIDRVPPLRLGLLVAGAIAWASGILFFNLSIIGRF